MRWSLWKKLSLGFSLISAILLIVGIKVYDGIKEARETTGHILHTDEIILRLDQLFSLLKDVETGQRGYILTGEDEYLRPYTESLPLVWTRMADIQSLTGDNPRQQENLELLKPVIRDKIQFVQAAIEKRRTEGEAAALVLVRTDRGRILMENIRMRISAMQDVEKELLSKRIATNNSTFKNVENTVLYGGIAALALIILTGGIVTFTTLGSLKELLRATESLAAGDLSYRAEVHTNDETRQLADAFNIMAQKLEESRREIIEQRELLEEETARVEMANAELNLKNEQLQALDTEKNEFLGIVAHDLKNPLFGIKGLAQILEKEYATLSPEEIQDFSADIRLSADRMFELISNLLNINALEQNGWRMEIQPFPITPAAEHAFNRYKQRAEAKNITLNFTSQTDAEIVADRSATMQILDNLVSNAVKYSPFGKKVYVRVLERDNKVRLEVQDEGPGLTPEDLKKLFGKFARLSAQPTGGEHSTGLGLSIVKKLVEAMNGNVWCESEFGVGSTFFVEFPKA
jgi:signal transduction histidine kinase